VLREDNEILRRSSDVAVLLGVRSSARPRTDSGRSRRRCSRRLSSDMTASPGQGTGLGAMCVHSANGNAAPIKGNLVGNHTYNSGTKVRSSTTKATADDLSTTVSIPAGAATRKDT